MTTILETDAKLSGENGEPDPVTQSWNEARQLVSTVGPAPRLFTSTVHFLTSDWIERDNTPSRHSKACLNQLLRSDSFTASMYYAASTYRPTELKETALGRRIAMIDLFRASELSILVSILYLFRRMRKGCDPSQFEKIASEMMRDIELAGKIGIAIPNIGLEVGMLVGGLPHLGHALLLDSDKKNFKKYRLRMKVEKKPFDLQNEFELWGCNHLQLAVLLAQLVGVKGKLLDPLVQGLSAKFLADTEKEPEAYRAKIAHLWMRHLLDTGEAPSMVHKGEYYPVAEDLKDIKDTAKTLRENGKYTNWLIRNHDDIGENRTPELFRFPEIGHNEDYLESLPEELRQGGDMGELTESELD